jgi:hypothetical protein
LTWTDRLTALAPGSARARVGFLWRPEPRFPGSVVAGRQLMAGNFRFGGALIEAPDTSPWTLSPPNDAFRDALAWLCLAGRSCRLAERGGAGKISGLGP